MLTQALYVVINVFMERSNVSLTVSQKKFLQREAIAEKCSIGDIIRRIIDAYIRDKK